MDTDTRDLVIVTGGAGFIGRALVNRLVERHAVMVFDQSCPEHLPAGAECVVVDLTSDDSTRAALERVRAGHGDRIASVIHLAAYFDLEGKPHPDYERVTVRGTERLLRELRAFNLEQFVFASTMLVHAPAPAGRRIAEDSPFDAGLPYRESKIQTEALLRERHGEVPVVFVRPAGVYDDRCRAAFLAHQIARVYERKLNSRIYPGNLDSGQPYLHVDDLVDALMRIVQRRRQLPPVLPLLLAEAETPTFRQLQDRIGCLVHGERWETTRIPQAVALLGASLEEKVLDVDPFIRPWMVEAASDHYEIDISRAQRLLGWRPQHALLADLPKIIEGLKRDPASWYRDNKLNPAVVADKTPAVRGDDASAKPHDHGEHQAAMQQHAQEMRDMHFGMLWVHWFNIALGAWLVSSPFAFGMFEAQVFGDAVRQVTVERELSDPMQRLMWLGVSDIAAGTLVMLFAILVPMMPGMSHEGMMDSSDMPPGWTYSPSTYLQRVPLVIFAFVGFVIARQLTAYQLGHVDGVWEPFFAGTAGRNGTETIITSDVSKAWPIADAGLGAVSYMLEVLMGVMGDRRRWRTMPWMVAAFGIVVVPLGVVSIYFIIIQPIVIGTWCTLCLIAAAAMLIMIPYTLDEVVAMGQFLVQSRRRGEPFWRTFFMGGASPGSGRDRHPGFEAPLAQSLAAALDGVNAPWTLVASALLGAWLMFTRLAFGTQPPMADSDHLVGALILTVAVSAMAEVGRLLRFINVALGLWLIAAPWVLDGATAPARIASVVVGAAVVALSLPRGPRSAEHYGNWDRFVL